MLRGAAGAARPRRRGAAGAAARRGSEGGRLVKGNAQIDNRLAKLADRGRSTCFWRCLDELVPNPEGPRRSQEFLHFSWHVKSVSAPHTIVVVYQPLHLSVPVLQTHHCRFLELGCRKQCWFWHCGGCSWQKNRAYGAPVMSFEGISFLKSPCKLPIH